MIRQSVFNRAARYSSLYVVYNTRGKYRRFEDALNGNSAETAVQARHSTGSMERFHIIESRSYSMYNINNNL